MIAMFIGNCKTLKQKWRVIYCGIIEVERRADLCNRIEVCERRTDILYILRYTFPRVYKEIRKSILY